MHLSTGVQVSTCCQLTSFNVGGYLDVLWLYLLIEGLSYCSASSVL